jgi:hypothetical protein
LEAPKGPPYKLVVCTLPLENKGVTWGTYIIVAHGKENSSLKTLKQQTGCFPSGVYFIAVSGSRVLRTLMVDGC